MEQKDELKELLLRVEILEGKMNQLLPWDRPAEDEFEPEPPNNYGRNQRIYHRLDEKSKAELIQIRKKLKHKYELLFSMDNRIRDNRSAKLERLYSVIDNRIVGNLKLWR
jgi:hypothetical protein